MSSHILDEVRTAQPKALRVFGKKAEVVGVGITEIDGGYGLKVNLREAPRPGVDLPESVDGVPVLVEVVGAIEILG